MEMWECTTLMIINGMTYSDENGDFTFLRG